LGWALSVGKEEEEVVVIDNVQEEEVIEDPVWQRDHLSNMYFVRAYLQTHDKEEGVVVVVVVVEDAA
jgi:hypothetical protein